MAIKKILILTNRVPFPLNDGGNMAMDMMIRGYKRAGWQVHLLSMNTSRHNIERDILQKLYTDIDSFETVDINNDVSPVQVLTNYLFSRQANHVSRFLHKTFTLKLREVLARISPDIVQFESVFLASYLPLVRSNSKALTVLRMHNIEYQVWHRLAGNTANVFKRKYLYNLASRIRKYEQAVWPRFDVLLPITKHDADVAGNYTGNARIRIVPYGITTLSAYTPVITENWKGYHIGAMDWLPNEEGVRWFLKEVWPPIHSKHPSFEFHFAGRNMPEDLNGLNSDGVFCHGEVPDAGAFIADKKILFVPIHSGGGIRIKIIEAMAAGKIIISTSVGMQGIEAVAGVHYLLANTPSEFTEATAKIFSDTEKAENMSKKAAEWVRLNYDANALSKGLVVYLESLMG